MNLPVETEDNMSLEIQNLTNSVNKLGESLNSHKESLAGKMGAVTTKVEAQEKLTKDIWEKVNQIALNQAGCESRNGYPAILGRLKTLDKKVSETRIKVESAFHPREDITGVVDEVALKAARAAKSESGGNTFKSLVKAIGPWLAAVLIGLGVYLGSGGDDEKIIKAINTINQIGHKVDDLEDRIISTKAKQSVDADGEN